MTGPALLGVKHGVRFRFTTGIQERWATVAGVRDKHLFRFEWRRDGYEARFPDRHDFQVVKVIRRYIRHWLRHPLVWVPR